MTQTFTTRFTALVLAAAIVAVSWLPTVTVPQASANTTVVASVA